MARGGNKFAAIFQQEPEPEAATKGQQIEAATEEPEPAAAPASVRIARAVGRPPGKRSDPAWKQYSVLLRRETQRQATDILRNRDEGDFSALVQRLVEQWVKSQRS
jgi:hypothetical protein